MNGQYEISDELLNAYVDGELSVEDQAELVTALRKNPELSEKLCQLRTLKEMLRVSYQNPHLDNNQNVVEKKQYAITRSMSFIAASVLLVIAVTIGAFGGFEYANKQVISPQFVQLNPTLEQNQHILLHIGTNQHERIQLALDNAEHLLNSFAAKNQKIKLQVLVNAEGINMLNSDRSPYIGRIQNLSRRYENITFLACQRSIERQMLKGVEVHVLKEATIIPEALQAIVNHLENGWIYIRA